MVGTDKGSSRKGYQWFEKSNIKVLELLKSAQGSFVPSRHSCFDQFDPFLFLLKCLITIRSGND